MVIILVSFCIVFSYLINNQESKNKITLFPENKIILASGKLIYNDQCASCHGINLQGQEGWQDELVDGLRLAPPIMKKDILGIIQITIFLCLLNMVSKNF